MARSYARAGPSQPSQTQITRAGGRVRTEDVVMEDQDEEENSDIEDEKEEEEEAAAPMDVWMTKLIR